MIYDLRPAASTHGLIGRIPHTNITYSATPDGIRVAVFYSKVHARILRTLLASPDNPPAPLELRCSATIDRVITDYTEEARL